MDFARKQLEKYGWSDGQGLGKHGTGIARALQPRLKRNVAGLGHDAAAEINDHWWSSLYDSAAGNIEVKEQTKISTKDPDAFKIASSTWSITKKSQNDSGFVRTSILTSGGARTERLDVSSESEDEVRPVVATDEQLFAACEGRTAHKGARHGLRAKGKLARIEEQERLLLAKPIYKGYSQTGSIISDDDSARKKELVNVDPVAETEISEVVCKKKRKSEAVIEHENSESVVKKKNKIKKKKIALDTDTIIDSDLNETVDAEVKHKKLPKELITNEQVESNEREGLVEMSEKVRKKKKSKNENCEDEKETCNISVEENEVKIKKTKKKNKNKITS